MKLRTAALASLLVAALFPSAAPASEPPRPTLRGTNILEAAGPASLEVRVPRGASIDTRESVFRRSGPNASVHVKGNGAFVGIVLEQQDGGFMFKAGRWDSCEPGCAARETFSYTEPTEGDTDFMTGGTFPRFLQVPPGDYRIYLISGGGPVAVRFNIKGLDGSFRGHAAQTASMDVQAMPERLDAPAPERLWAAGSTFESGTEGFFISNLFIEARDLRDLRFGICSPNGPTAPPEEVAYGPQCTLLASATGAGFYGTVSEPEWGERGYYLIQFSSFYDERIMPPNLTGERGLGTWFSTSSKIKNAGAQAVFISTG